jgi:hypothetical protein
VHSKKASAIHHLLPSREDEKQRMRVDGRVNSNRSVAPEEEKQELSDHHQM